MLKILLAILLLLPLPAQAGDEDRAGNTRDLAAWAAGGVELLDPEDPTQLALRLLEWDYLAEWTRDALAGRPAGEGPGRWARMRELRDTGDAPPAGEVIRRRRGACLFEDLAPTNAELLAICDSLTSGRYGPVPCLAEGILAEWHLSALGASACGDPGDPVLLLARALGETPGLSLIELKRGADFPALYFAAEREVERWQRRRLAEVQNFLAQPGRLISVKYGFWKILDLEFPTAADRPDSEHWLYPEGLVVDWGEGRRFEVRDLPVLHTPEQNLLQVVEPDKALTLQHEDEILKPQFGEYELHGSYRVETAHVRLDVSGGRYRYDGSELRFWWPSNFFSANRRGFLFALLVLLVTGYLLVQNQRKKRELARPIERYRPGR